MGMVSYIKGRNALTQGQAFFLGRESHYPRIDISTAQLGVISGHLLESTLVDGANVRPRGQLYISAVGDDERVPQLPYRISSRNTF